MSTVLYTLIMCVLIGWKFPPHNVPSLCIAITSTIFRQRALCNNVPSLCLAITSTIFRQRALCNNVPSLCIAITSTIFRQRALCNNVPSLCIAITSCTIFRQRALCNNVPSLCLAITSTIFRQRALSVLLIIYSLLALLTSGGEGHCNCDTWWQELQPRWCICSFLVFYDWWYWNWNVSVDVNFQSSFMYRSILKYSFARKSNNLCLICEHIMLFCATYSKSL